MNLLLVLLMVLCSLEVLLLLADLSRRSIIMIRNMAKRTTTEVAEMMIIRMEMEGKMPWCWLFA